MPSKTSKLKSLPQFKIRAEFHVCKGDNRLRLVTAATGADATHLHEYARFFLELDLRRFDIDPAAVDIDLWDAQYFAEKRPLTCNWVPVVRHHKSGAKCTCRRISAKRRSCTATELSK